MNKAASASARRMSTESNPGSSHRQISRSRIPMGSSRSVANHLANTQPSYDFLAGPGLSDSPPRQSRRMSLSKPLRTGSRPPSRAESRAPGSGDDFRAQVKTLQYELDALKQERDRAKLRQETEERELKAKHELELRNAKLADHSKYVTIEKYQALKQELAASKEDGTSRSGDMEKRLRSLKEQNQHLKEELVEVQAELDSQSRGTKRQLEEIETKHTKLVKTLNDLRADLENKDNALQTSQQKLTEREAELGALEAENMRLRAQGGDLEEFSVVKREFTEQVAYNRKLEITNREQTTELRRLRDQAKTVGVIQEEKRVLEIQVERMDKLERELGEAKFQRQLLEDEKFSWKAYLQNSMTDEFDSPEAIAKALTSERLEHASLLDKLGRLQPELAAKEAEMLSLRGEIEKLKQKSSGQAPAASAEDKARARLERQKTLAQKEIEYLRAQLKTFETEDTTNIDLEPASASDQATKARIATLEDLVAQYRAEVETASKELKSTSAPEKSLKRPSPSPEDSERISVLTRKLQTLQSTLSKTESRSRSLSSELSATKTQLTHLQSTSRTRILSLRDNPTDHFTKEKSSTIAILRQENTDLHSQLSSLQQSDPRSTRSTSQALPTDLIPQSYLASARSEIQALQTQLASSQKSLSRLREIWSSKSLELRTAVASLLGWRMDILPNGKFRLTSIFHPSLVDEGKDAEDRIWDTSFVFDGESGTMKIAGGSGSAFGQEVQGLVRYWVEGRKEIPGFLAACTMEWVEGRGAVV